MNWDEYLSFGMKLSNYLGCKDPVLLNILWLWWVPQLLVTFLQFAVLQNQLSLIVQLNQCNSFSFKHYYLQVKYLQSLLVSVL